ncbi:hypothetical protein KCMC57_up04430 [Kitasatospora sp. CMC57]|uniref:Uncharacterized protein n=1 Tax=Kitasatospora sp. CMC57 TaxID=3231513 RepID=A0AB33JRG6_9ACTN
MLIVLNNGGSPGTAYGVHGLTALAAATAALLLRERPRSPRRVSPNEISHSAAAADCC